MGLSFKYRDRERAAQKIAGATSNGLVIGTGTERTSWYYVDDKREFRVTVGQNHSGDLPTGTARAIIRDLKLNQSKFGELVSCTMSGADYHDFIRALRDQGKL